LKKIIIAQVNDFRIHGQILFTRNKKGSLLNPCLYKWDDVLLQSYCLSLCVMNLVRLCMPTQIIVLRQLQPQLSQTYCTDTYESESALTQSFKYNKGIQSGKPTDSWTQINEPSLSQDQRSVVERFQNAYYIE